MKYYKLLFVLFAFSIVLTTAASAQWEADQRLTNTAGNSFLANNNAWNIAASGDTVHVVFTDDITGAAQIYYTCSYNAGINWNTPIVLSQDTCNISNYTIAVSGSTVHVVWVNLWNRKLMYRRSTDAGVSWSQAVAVVNPGIQNVGDPCLAVSGNNVYLVYTHNPSGGYNVDLFFISSTNSGVTWGASQRLTYDTNSILDGAPSIAVNGNILHLIWGRSYYPGWHRRVLYLRSTNNGASWEPERYITNDTVSQTQPCIAASGNYVHAVWMDQRTGDSVQIYYRSSADNGVNWQTEKCLTNNVMAADYQTIAAIGRNVHVTWRDYRFNQQWHIGYRRSMDNGQTWQPDTFLNDLYHQESPSIAVAGSKVHLIWIDNRDGNWEIYYKRNPTGSGIEETNRIPLTANRTPLEIYPNPAKAFFNIRLPQTADRSQIKIFDISGKLIKEIGDCFANARNDGMVRISLDGIKNGVYFIKVGKKTLKEKLVITK